MVATLAHRHGEFAENIPEFHESVGSEKRRFVGGTHKREAHFFIFAAGCSGQVLEIADFFAAGILEARKTHTAVRVKIVGSERLQDPRLERRLETVGIQAARLEHIQAINDKRGVPLCHPRPGRGSSFYALAESLPERRFCRSHERRFTQTPAKAHVAKRKINAERHQDRTHRSKKPETAPFRVNFGGKFLREPLLENFRVNPQVIFLFGRNRRNVAIKLLHLSKDFVEAEERSLVRFFLELVAEGVVYKRTLAIQLLFRSLGHLTDDGFFHPFAPLVNRERKRRGCHLRKHVVRQIKRDAVTIAHRIEDHLAHHHAAGTVESFDAELLKCASERGLEVGAALTIRHGGPRSAI